MAALFLSFFLLGIASAQEVSISTGAPGERQAKSQLYELGTLERKRGNARASKEAFRRMLELDPGNGGALEGIALACLASGENDEARRYLEQWNAQSPKNAYILSLLARAYAGLKKHDQAAQTYAEIVMAEPLNLAAWRRLDDLMESRLPGVFPRVRAYKSVGTEGLGTADPLQRIVYEGRSAGVVYRPPINPNLDLKVGATVRQEAQRNDTRGFVYYDLLEQLYSLGFVLKPWRDFRVDVDYTQSIFSGNKDNSVERTLFSRISLATEFNVLDSVVRLGAKRSPKLLRGAGGNRYFGFLREVSARAEIETYRLGWDWRAKAGINEFSESTVFQDYLLIATKEYGNHLLQPSYSHDNQEFFGADPSGRIGSVGYDRWRLRYRWQAEAVASATLSYAFNSYHDANRLHEFGGEAKYWLTWYKDISFVYSYDRLDFAASPPGYRNTDEDVHRLGAWWMRGHGHGLWTKLGYEKTFYDDIRGSYEGNTYMGELEWHIARDSSLEVQGKLHRSTVRDDAYAFAIQARYNF